MIINMKQINEIEIVLPEIVTGLLEIETGLPQIETDLPQIDILCFELETNVDQMNCDHVLTGVG